MFWRTRERGWFLLVTHPRSRGSVCQHLHTDRQCFVTPGYPVQVAPAQTREPQIEPGGNSAVLRLHQGRAMPCSVDSPFLMSLAIEDGKMDEAKRFL